MKRRPFIHDDFLLETRAARKLYHEWAEPEPILDYHSHLSPRDIAQNRQYGNLFELWLEGDHYKWRAMRSNGVSERFCTGDATPFEKFQAWAATVPFTLRNPLYHWVHLELKRYFGIDELLDSQSAQRIWDRTQARLASPEFTARGLLKTSRVVALCTTDDPADDLVWHRQLAHDPDAPRVFPTFRPDKALAVDRPAFFNEWLGRLEKVCARRIRTYAALQEALQQRHLDFHALGGRLSDHGLSYCYSVPCTDAKAAAIFKKARAGQAASPAEHAQYAANLMLFFGRLDAERDWTKQLHLGALRNNNSRLFQAAGADTGFDSIGDWPQAQTLAAYLDALDREQALPKIILYNLNPADNYVFATMLGNFQDGSIPGKVQWGSGWWFLDQKEGMEWQLNALSNLGLLSRFVGMLTDSRSFLSFPRHEYFRRVLCNLLGRDVERGEIPNDPGLLGPMIRGICHQNARQYLGLTLP